jgi:hypothetical protein
VGILRYGWADCNGMLTLFPAKVVILNSLTGGSYARQGSFLAGCSPSLRVSGAPCLHRRADDAAFMEKAADAFCGWTERPPGLRRLPPRSITSTVAAHGSPSPQRHQLALLGGAELRPGIHELAALLEGVATPIGLLDVAADEMRKPRLVRQT